MTDNGYLRTFFALTPDELLAQRHGFAPEARAFKGHLTLARARRTFPGGVELNLPFAKIESTASEIILYRSDTQPAGAVYTPLATFPLAGRRD